MASDQTVSARAILRAESELKRIGHHQTMNHLEQIEPDLSSHLWEQLSAINRQLLALGGPPQTSHECYRQIQHLMLVTFLAMRHGHHELWQDLHAPPPPPDDPGDHNSD